MELKLNIYKRGQIVKTYTTSTYDVELGICEDLLNLLQLEKYADADKLGNIPVSDIVGIVVKNYDKFIDLLHDIFPELTEEERRHIKLVELKDLFIALAKDTVTKLFNFSQKN